MREVCIFVEGGGRRKDGQTALRRGLGTFLAELHQAARHHRSRWRIIPCGGRSETIRDFLTALGEEPGTLKLLLVNAEGAVSTTPRLHLFAGHPAAGHIDDDQCHLMVQMMEAWLVADREALARFYGQGFRAAALPARDDVEGIPKADLEAALANATRDTQKGSYQKIRHGARILELVDPRTVRARAPHCDRLFTIVLGKLA